ncbi:MAG: thiol peroxidase [Bacteroidales bacterium]|nr:thiol peroxidase [Bacteroidales bacterium]MDZ4205117.1 thiol peroxidase [Bacteroidales bacterium]
MRSITLKGNIVHISGELPSIGSKAPDFKLVKSDLGEMALSELKGKKVLLNISPSLDTGICATALRVFNEKAAGIPNTIILAITKDLPFAMGRFCTAEGIENVISLSAFRDQEFGRLYGIEIIDGPFAGLLARSIVVVDENGKVVYTELVPEIAQEPDYEKALAAI